jgi:hypothetical protein
MASGLVIVSVRRLVVGEILALAIRILSESLALGKRRSRAADVRVLFDGGEGETVSKWTCHRWGGHSTYA